MRTPWAAWRKDEKQMETQRAPVVPCKTDSLCSRGRPLPARQGLISQNRLRKRDAKIPSWTYREGLLSPNWKCCGAEKSRSLPLTAHQSQVSVKSLTVDPHSSHPAMNKRVCDDRKQDRKEGRGKEIRSQNQTGGGGMVESAKHSCPHQRGNRKGEKEVA